MSVIAVLIAIITMLLVRDITHKETAIYAYSESAEEPHALRGILVAACFAGVALYGLAAMALAYLSS